MREEEGEAPGKREPQVLERSRGDQMRVKMEQNERRNTKEKRY
jgi:hypothetical protein